MLFRQHLGECRVHGGQSADDPDHSRDVRDSMVPYKVRRGQHEECDRQGQEHELEGISPVEGSKEHEQGHDAPQEAEHTHGVPT